MGDSLNTHLKMKPPVPEVIYSGNLSYPTDKREREKFFLNCLERTGGPCMRPSI